MPVMLHANALPPIRVSMRRSIAPSNRPARISGVPERNQAGRCGR